MYKQISSAATGCMDSDDDEMPPFPVLRGGTTFLGRMMRFVSRIRVYDIRGKNACVQDEYTHESTDPMTGNKLDLAAHLGLDKEFVYSAPGMDSAVLHDNRGLLIIFIHYKNNPQGSGCIGLDPNSPIGTLKSAIGCIGLDPNSPIGTLKSAIRDDKRFNKGQIPCLFLKGKRCDEDSSLVGSLFTNGDVVECHTKSDVKIQCFHIPRLNVEHKYEFQCFSTDNVWEMKQAFKKSFCSEFPGFASGNDDVWFSAGKRILEDEEYITLGPRRRLGQHTGRLDFHVRQASSFPLTLRMNSEEHSSQFMLISAPITTAELRGKVSLLIKQPPSALYLYTKNKKLKEMVLSESDGIHPNGVVLAKVAKKIQIFVSWHADGSTNRIALQLFKLDSVLRLKELLQEHTYAAVSQLQLFFNEKELENERLMQDYRIREDDIIDACVFSKPEYIVVRQPGREPLHLTIDGLQYTIGRLKEYLVHALGCSYDMINMIHRGRCLPDDETLEQCGLVSGSTVLIQRLATQDQSTNERILKVYESQGDGTFQIAFAKEAAGTLFYAPKSVNPGRFEKHTMKSVKQDEDYRRGIILRKLCTEIHPCSHKSIPQSEVIRPCGSGQQTSRSDEQSVSASTAQGKRKHPQRLDHIDSLGDCSYPVSLRSKRPMYRKRVSETRGHYIIEESTLDVCTSNANEVFPRIIQTPSEVTVAAEKVVAFRRSSSLQNPVEAISDHGLYAVSKQLGNDWKEVALALGLGHSDIESIEHSHSRQLNGQAWQALILWKKRNSRNATTASLKKTLHDCGLALTADSIDESSTNETT